MTIPNHNYLVYKDMIDSTNKMKEFIENKTYCFKLQDALFICREKNAKGIAKNKCDQLDKFIKQIDCYNPYK